MSPDLNGSSTLERFKPIIASEICNGIMFILYLGLPHMVLGSLSHTDSLDDLILITFNQYVMQNSACQLLHVMVSFCQQEFSQQCYTFMIENVSKSNHSTLQVIHTHFTQTHTHTHCTVFLTHYLLCKNNIYIVCSRQLRDSVGDIKKFFEDLGTAFLYPIALSQTPIATCDGTGNLAAMQSHLVLVV